MAKDKDLGLIAAADLRALAAEAVKVEDLKPCLEKITKELITAQKEGKTTTRVKVTKFPVRVIVLTNELIDAGYSVSQQLVGTDTFLVVGW
jgi:hypothetical protein